MSGPVAVLIGPPGAGKSAVASRLAELLDVDEHDTDAAVEAEDGRSISDIFVTSGEAEFRRMERAAVATALADQRGVVALGGGAPMDAETQQRLEGVTVVFLDVGITDAAHRIGFDRSRPLLGVAPRATWTALMAARRPVYERLATFTVDTTGATVDEVAERIAQLLQEPTRQVPR